MAFFSYIMYIKITVNGDAVNGDAVEIQRSFPSHSSCRSES